MRFLCITPKSDNWFEAAALNDIEFLKANLEYAGRFDDRATSNEHKTIFGTAAIHVAAMFNNQESVNILFEKEHNLKTKTPLKVVTDGLPNATAFQLAAGQDVLHIAIARAEYNLARQILTLCEEEPENSIIGQLDDDGHSHLMLLAYFPFNSDIKELVNNKQLLSEFASCVEGRGFMQICCMMGRDEHFLEITRLAGISQQIKKHLFLQLTAVHQEKTIFGFLKQKIDFEKCSSTQEDRRKCYQYVHKLLPMALRFLQKDNKQYGLHLSEFFRFCDEKVNIDAPDVDLITFWKNGGEELKESRSRAVLIQERESDDEKDTQELPEQQAEQLSGKLESDRHNEEAKDSSTGVNSPLSASKATNRSFTGIVPSESPEDKQPGPVEQEDHADKSEAEQAQK